MLSQYTEQKPFQIEKFSTDNGSVNQQVSNNQPSKATNSMDGNCPTSESRQNSSVGNGFSMKMKLKKLQQLYQQGLEKLVAQNQQNEIQQKQKIEIKRSLEQKLFQSSPPNEQSQSISHRKIRKGSQTSTAGQDEQSKINSNIGQNVLKTQHSFSMHSLCVSSADYDSTFLSALKQKLLRVREENTQAKRVGQLKIGQLKNSIFEADKIQKIAIKEEHRLSHSKSQQSKQFIQLQLKLTSLQSQKSNLLSQKTSLAQKVTETKRSIQNLSNNVEYLRSTQTCCQEILNEQLCSIQYKLQGRRLQYDSNKRYLDKIIRMRKYEQNISFQEIRSEIQYLNEYCEQMMEKKKDYYAPEIKKYKQKRLIIMEQIKELKDKYVMLEKEKHLIQIKTKQQNKIYDQLQDQYCALLEKIDQKTLANGHQLSPQEKVKLLKEKKDLLTHELKHILTQYQEIKSQIQNDQSVVPLNIIKDLRKRTQRKKQEIHEIEILTKQNLQLEKENKILIEEKDKIEWKTNPDIEKFNKQEKDLKTSETQLRQKIKQLKDQNQVIEDKLNKMKQVEKLKKSNQSTKFNQEKEKKLLKQKQEQEKIKKQEEEKLILNRSKLIEKFRQKPEEKTKEEDFIDSKICTQKQKDLKQKPIKSIKQNSNQLKKTKNPNNKDGSQIGESKNGIFFGRRENPLESLQRDFPLNSSQETFQNISLLQSDPGLYMMVIFVTVVIPGLIVGYNF